MQVVNRCNAGGCPNLRHVCRVAIRLSGFFTEPAQLLSGIPLCKHVLQALIGPGCIQ